MAERSADWFRQARRDLDSARAQRTSGFFEWACFISQHASEKALKAVLQRLGAEVWGHSIVDLLRTLKERIDVPRILHDLAINLDRYYIPARYPNGWASGSPADYCARRSKSEPKRRSVFDPPRQFRRTIPEAAANGEGVRGVRSPYRLTRCPLHP